MSDEPALVEICAALGDETRWQILQHLGRESLSASALAERVPVTRQAITRHLDVLHAAGLVERGRLGREVRYLAVAPALSALAHHLHTLAAGWDHHLDTLRATAEAAAHERDEPAVDQVRD